MEFDKELSEIYPWIQRMARKFCKSIQDAEDLAGDTIYRILVNKNKFDSSKALKPWCLAVMQNIFITSYNRNALVQFTGYDSILEENSPNKASDMAMFNDILSAIRRCAQKSKCMDCLVYCAKGFSYDEISDILHVPVGTVGSRISFGRKLLSKELED